MASTTIIDEMRSAARGVVALLMGNRRAADYFDFSRRGLYGSFIALLFITALTSVLPMMLGLRGPSASFGRSIIEFAIMFAFQVAFSAIVLRQLNRLDGLVPYLVADNWAAFFISAATTILVLVGLPSSFTVIVLGILVLIIVINISRLIVTLTPLQIAMFLIAQLVGVSVAMILIGVLFPPSPDELAAIEQMLRSAR